MSGNAPAAAAVAAQDEGGTSVCTPTPKVAGV